MPNGIVYILSNEAMPGYIKVGITEKGMDHLIRTLDDSRVPLPYKLQISMQVEDAGSVEERIRGVFRERRVENRRDFFRVDPNQIQLAFMNAESTDAASTEEVVNEREDPAPARATTGRRRVSKKRKTVARKRKRAARKRRSGFGFELVGIPPGSTLNFKRDHDITCTVIDNKLVRYEDEDLSLSRAALRADTTLGGSSGVKSGPRFWVFEGEDLAQRRRRMEKER